MADVIAWGTLPKSQDDPQTIDEAIAAQIANHDADSEAHRAEGASLQAHRTDGVIDHPPRSVYADKAAYDRLQFFTLFDTPDFWDKTAGVSFDFIGQVRITTTSVNGNTQGMNILWADSLQAQTPAQLHPFFKTTVLIESITNIEEHIGPFNMSDGFGYGFRIVNGALSAVWYDTDNTLHEESLGGISNEQFLTLEFYIDADEVGHWLVDDSEVFTDDLTTITGANFLMSYSVKTTHTGSEEMIVRDCAVECDYPTA